MLDVSSVVTAFESGTYTVSRPDASTYNLGILAVPAVTAFTVGLSVQPLSGKDLQKLPEGTRMADGLTVFSTTELLAHDVVSVEGREYEVHHVESWLNLGQYWRCLALRVGQ